MDQSQQAGAVTEMKSPPPVEAREMRVLWLSVIGEPIPQGSMKALMPKGGRFPVVMSDNKRTMPWRQQIAGTALATMNELDYRKCDRSLPIAVELCFVFEKPKSAKKSIIAKTTKPDVDKLARNVLDALTGVVFEDDSQVTELKAVKVFGDTPGVNIRITAEF
jgi:Holliday junction resolvase RusA-like endonuclease